MRHLVVMISLLAVAALALPTAGWSYDQPLGLNLEGAGLLLPPGDVGALRAALSALAEGRALATPAPPLPVRTAAEGAAELAWLYGALRGTPRPGGPGAR